MKRENKTQYALLGILTQYECSGYDIKKFIETSLGFFWSESFGQIYPNLKKLQSEGSIRQSRLVDAKGAPSIIYSITDAGRRKLRQWLAQDAEPLAHRNELLLKLFFGSELDNEQVKEHLARSTAANQKLLTTYNGIEKQIAQYEGKSADWPFWQMTLDYGILHARMELEWAKRALALLNKTSKSKKGKSK